MNDDWTILTDERRRDLVQALRRLHDTFSAVNFALLQFLSDTAETIATKTKQMQHLVDKVARAEPELPD